MDGRVGGRHEVLGNKFLWGKAPTAAGQGLQGVPRWVPGLECCPWLCDAVASALLASPMVSVKP